MPAGPAEHMLWVDVSANEAGRHPRSYRAGRPRIRKALAEVDSLQVEPRPAVGDRPPVGFVRTRLADYLEG